MTGTAQRASVTCELCGKKLQINFRQQAIRFCRKCDGKVQKTATGILQQVENEKKIEALSKRLEKEKLARKKAEKKPKFRCPKCESIFECPECGTPVKKAKAKTTVKKPVKAKKPASKKVRKTTKTVVKKGGKTNVKS